MEHFKLICDVYVEMLYKKLKILYASSMSSEKICLYLFLMLLYLWIELSFQCEKREKERERERERDRQSKLPTI